MYSSPFPRSPIRRLIRTGPKTSRIVVSVPIALSSPEDDDLAALEEKGVKGRYASVERILELPGDKVEWRMAVSGSSGGLIPQFIADSVMPKEVSKVGLSLVIYPFITDILTA